MKYFNGINYLVWLTLSALFFAAGEFLSKKFAISPRWSYVLLILATYSLGTLAWLPAILQRNQLSVVGTIWSVMSLLATVSIGVLMFQEKVNFTAGIGMVFAVVAIVLLSLS